MNFPLYLVTDSRHLSQQDLLDRVLQSIRGGVTAVQLREKDSSTQLFIEFGRALKDLLKPYKVPLIINDRVDIALAVQAEGVHLGQSDMDPSTARLLMGERAIIGWSVETQEHVEIANQLPINYIAASPVFPTPTKTDVMTPWGLEGLSNIRRSSKHYLVAIGGIHHENVSDVIQAGADSIAVVSAILGASCSYQAAKTLREKIQGAGIPLPTFPLGEV